MELKFWIHKWENGETRFHLSEVNPLLIQFFPPNIHVKNILVPLCGKTLDLIYLAGKCNHLTGIECSERAILDFFLENSLEFTQADNRYTSGNITLIHSDIFQFKFQKQFDFIYDRAASVALPIKMREKYHQVLKDNLDELGQIFLIAFEMDQDIMQGPPFYVNSENINQNFKDFKIKIIHQSLQKKSPTTGTFFTEKIYLICK